MNLHPAQTSTMKMFTLFLSFIFCSDAMAQAGGVESEIYNITGNPDASFGRMSANIGDIDGDGVDDFIVRGIDSGTVEFISAISGATQAVLYRRNAFDQNYYVRGAIAGGHDFDGDGVPDFAVSRFSDIDPDGSVSIYSGAKGALIRNIKVHSYSGLGRSMIMVEDLNGDGCADLIIGSSTDLGGGGGSVHAYSAKDGELIYAFGSRVAGDALGVAVCELSDLNGDGIVDFAVSSPYKSVARIQRGVVDIHSGADGVRLLQRIGDADNDHLGSSLASIGDLDGDGVSEVLAGARLRDAPAGQNIPDSGGATIFSPVTGVILRRHYGEFDDEQMGSSVSSAGDVDRDGTVDYLIRSASTNELPSGSVKLFSGATGLLLHTFFDSSPNQYLFGSGYGGFGYSISLLDDLDGNGVPEFIIGSPFYQTAQDGGKITRYSFDTFITANIYTASAANGGVLTYSLNFPVAASGMEYKVLLSRAGVGPSLYGVDIPLSFDGFLIDSYNGIYPFATFSNLQGVLDASGDATASFNTPVGLSSNLIGQSLYIAAIAGPAGQLPSFSSTVVSLTILP